MYQKYIGARFQVARNANSLTIAETGPQFPGIHERFLHEELQLTGVWILAVSQSRRKNMGGPGTTLTMRIERQRALLM